MRNVAAGVSAYVSGLTPGKRPFARCHGGAFIIIRQVSIAWTGGSMHRAVRMMGNRFEY